MELLEAGSSADETTALAWPSREQDSYGEIFERFLSDFENYRKQEEERRSSIEVLIHELQQMSGDEREMAIGADLAFHDLRVAQGLLDLSRQERQGNPHEAASLARLALKVADHISLDEVRPTMVEDVRLRAWTYVATARIVAGELVGAAEALRLAEAHQAGGSQDASEAALVIEAKAILRRNQGEFDESERLFQRAREIFASLKDGMGVYRSRLNLANVYSAQGRYKDASSLLEETLRELDEEALPQQALRVRHNLVDCLVESGQLMKAQALLARSKQRYAEFGDALILLRREWIEGRIALATGRPELAERAFRQVRDGFIEAGIGFDAALVSLELALFHLERNDVSSAQALAAEMLPIFQAQDLHRHALAALTVFQQAASQARLSVSLVAHIKSFLNRARNDPSLTYEPPVAAEA